MDYQNSDALVFFGATGDLAHKQIFPALQALVKRHGLEIPIVGVAKAGWNLLQYVDGDYKDADTYSRLRQTLGQSRRPLHYLAIPPSMFGPVAEGLASSGCATDARVVIEKPF